jgi:hypothetical protein
VKDAGEGPWCKGRLSFGNGILIVIRRLSPSRA